MSVKIYAEFRAIVNGDLRAGGSRTSSADISVAGEVYEAATTVQDNYNLETLWTAGDGGVSDFDFLWFESDVDVLLQLKHGSAYQVHEVKGGAPFMLSSDVVQNVQISDGAQQTATLDDIDQIDVHRNVADAVGDATVRLVLIS